MLFLLLFSRKIPMDGRKLAFLLDKLGITREQYGEMVGRSARTIQRWTERPDEIGEVYEAVIEKVVGKPRFAKIEKEYEALYPKEAE